MTQANVAAALMELSGIVLTLTEVVRRHVANTSVTSDVGVTERNLNDLDSLEERVRALMRAG
jgi:hypothetical protein